ncbi:molecular chaperone DnaK, partial [Lachnospiraceae bacterium OttesenSCG-928-D06]|nr:molecular chaperone DnaK [Lachnospiraceae bacterium OttesenSCG-928-D06]
ARNDADAFVFQTEKSLTEVGDKLDESEKAQVQADVEAVKAILLRTADQEMSDNDLDELKAAKEKLTNSAQNLFTKMYENAQGQAGPDMSGAGAGADMGQGAAPEDDVIDGDFREV